MTAPAVGWRQWFRPARITKTVPELDEAEKRSGATFVNILFGLVVSDGVRQVVVELRQAYLASDFAAIYVTRLSHLVLALLVTTLSWIGYHQSQKYPPFIIKFVNIPLFTFTLDVAMVGSYYALIATAENPGRNLDPVIAASARPEAWLLAGIFVLYVAWDEAGFRLFRDPQYSFRMETPREPEEKRGPRRMVTLGALMAALLMGTLALVIDPAAPGAVVTFDIVLALIAIGYRLAKQGVQYTVVIRGDASRTPPELAQWYEDRSEEKA